MPGGLSSVALGVDFGGFGATLGSAWPLLTALFLIAFGVAFAVTAFVAGRRRTLAAPELAILPEGREREALAESLEREMEEAEPVEESPPASVAAPAPVDRAEKLRAAFESGRITREAYEANLARLGLAVEARPLEPAPAIASLSEPEPTPPPAPPEGVEAKVARLQVALESGRISRAAYEENLRRLGVAAPVEAPEPSEDELKARKLERLRSMLAEGRISQEAFDANLRKLGVEPEAERAPEELAPEEVPPPAPVPPAPSVEDKVAKLRAAFEAGRIPRAAYEANLRKLGFEPEPEAPPAIAPAPQEIPPAPVPSVEEKVAKLRGAFEAGRISRATYESNLRKLGVEPEAEAPPEEERAPEELPPEPTPAPPPTPTVEERVARLRAAFQAGRIPREAYEANLRKLGVEPEPEAPPEAIVPQALPPPAPAPSVEDRIAKLRAAFEAGRIPRPTYESNLRRLGVEPEAGRVPEELAPEEVPPPAPVPPAPSVEDKVAKLRTAFEAGRIPRATYESNLQKLGVAPGPVQAPAAPPAPAKPRVPSVAERAARIHEAYQAGRMTREQYVRNVGALGVEPLPEPAPEAPPIPPPPAAPAPPPEPAPVPPPTVTPEGKLAKLRAAFAAGRITRESYAANAKALGYDVRALGLEMAVEAPVPPPPRALSPEERIERMHVAYRAGKMPRELYVTNVASLGGTPLPESASSPEERVARLRAAFEAGKMTRQAYEANLAKLGLVPPPPPAEVANPPAPESPAPPSNVEERADLLTSMFVNGKISRAVYEKNLGRVYEGSDPRLVSLRLALADGRIPRETYEANARRLRGGT